MHSCLPGGPLKCLVFAGVWFQSLGIGEAGISRVQGLGASCVQVASRVQGFGFSSYEEQARLSNSECALGFGGWGSHKLLGHETTDVGENLSSTVLRVYVKGDCRP